MNKSELVAKIAQDANLTRAQAEAALNATTAAIEGALVAGDKVTLTGFGAFSVSKRDARDGRNPQTGDAVKIPAAFVPKFKAGENLKSAVNRKK